MNTLSSSESSVNGNGIIAQNVALIKKATVIVRALDSAPRQKIMELIHRMGKASVTEIYQQLSMDQPIASRHLAVLREAKMVNTERNGKYIYYTVNQSGIEKIIGCVRELLHEN